METNQEDSDLKENWILQRRGGKSPQILVPMVVPKPNVDTKVLIGDQEAEETSDLSDVTSEVEEEIQQSTSINSILIESKTLIGGKNKVRVRNVSRDSFTDVTDVKEDVSDKYMSSGGSSCVETSNLAAFVDSGKENCINIFYR